MHSTRLWAKFCCGPRSGELTTLSIYNVKPCISNFTEQAKNADALKVNFNVTYSINLISTYLLTSIN